MHVDLFTEEASSIVETVGRRGQRPSASTAGASEGRRARGRRTQDVKDRADINDAGGGGGGGGGGDDVFGGGDDVFGGGDAEEFFGEDGADEFSLAPEAEQQDEEDDDDDDHEETQHGDGEDPKKLGFTQQLCRFLQALFAKMLRLGIRLPARFQDRFPELRFPDIPFLSGLPGLPELGQSLVEAPGKLKFLLARRAGARQFKKFFKQATETDDESVPDEEVPGGDDAVDEDPMQLKRFTRGLPSVDISDKAVEDSLRKSRFFRVTTLDGNTAVSKGVYEIRASLSVIWSQLLDFSTFPIKVNFVGTAEVYNWVTLRDGAPADRSAASDTPQAQRTIGHSFAMLFAALQFPGLLLAGFPVARFQLREFLQQQKAHHEQQSQALFNVDTSSSGSALEKIFVKFITPIAPGVRLTSYCEMVWEPALHSYTFQLDRAHKSDLIDYAGHYVVTPNPSDPSTSLLYYNMEVIAPKWIPSWSFKIVAGPVMRDSVMWAQREAEREVLDPNSDPEKFPWLKPEMLPKFQEVAK